MTRYISLMKRRQNQSVAMRHDKDTWHDDSKVKRRCKIVKKKKKKDNNFVTARCDILQQGTTLANQGLKNINILNSENPNMFVC